MRMATVIVEAAAALARLERVVAAVKGQGSSDPSLAASLSVLESLSRKEAIPLAIVGGLGAIHHGYERFTKDIDVVVPREHLDIVARVAPRYGIKVIWRDPQGWHKLRYEGVNIDVVPEGGKPRKDAPTTIPSPRQLGVAEGLDYAGLAGWMETKISSNCAQDRADIVQVMKTTASSSLAKVRKAIGKVHQTYLERYDELRTMAEEEKKQERRRGRPR
jgi:hypothetical protein